MSLLGRLLHASKQLYFLLIESVTKAQFFSRLAVLGGKMLLNPTKTSYAPYFY